jgi:hypothetical protein
MITWLQYVPHSRMLLFLARGWVIEDELHSASHGEHALLMRWPFEGEPPR